MLAEELDEHFEEYTATETDDETAVIVADRMPAGMYHPDEFEVFEDAIEQFVLQYTGAWQVERTNMNPIEGQSTAVLTRTDAN